MFGVFDLRGWSFRGELLAKGALQLNCHEPKTDKFISKQSDSHFIRFSYSLKMPLSIPFSIYLKRVVFVKHEL